MDDGRPYHLWLRMKADNNSYANDSVFVQFTNSQDGTRAAAWQIGTTSALVVSLEEGSGAGVAGWGWNDNAYGSLGAPVYFASSGTQRIRIQVREDGVSIDQVVLSAANYLSISPGSLKNDARVLAEANVVAPGSAAAGNNEMVRQARSVSTATGTGAKVSDATAVNGVRVRTPDDPVLTKLILQRRRLSSTSPI